MTPVKINGKTYQCVTSFQEMKTRHYVRVLKEWDQDKDVAERDYFKLLSILTDTNYIRTDSAVENDITIMDCVGWVITQPFEFDKELPKVMEVSGKIIEVPRDPASLSIGQNIHLRRDYIDKSVLIEESMAIATAIYLQPIIDNGKFSMARARELAKTVDEMPISIVYPIGFFLLKRASTFGMPSGNRWSRTLTSLKTTLKQMLPSWPKSTGSSRSTIST